MAKIIGNKINIGGSSKIVDVEFEKHFFKLGRRKHLGALTMKVFFELQVNVDNVAITPIESSVSVKIDGEMLNRIKETNLLNL